MPELSLFSNYKVMLFLCCPRVNWIQSVTVKEVMWEVVVLKYAIPGVCQSTYFNVRRPLSVRRKAMTVCCTFRCRCHRRRMTRRRTMTTTVCWCSSWRMRRRDDETRAMSSSSNNNNRRTPANLMVRNITTNCVSVKITDVRMKKKLVFLCHLCPYLDFLSDICPGFQIHHFYSRFHCMWMMNLRVSSGATLPQHFDCQL